MIYKKNELVSLGSIQVPLDEATANTYYHLPRRAVAFTPEDVYTLLIKEDTTGDAILSCCLYRGTSTEDEEDVYTTIWESLGHNNLLWVTYGRDMLLASTTSYLWVTYPEESEGGTKWVLRVIEADSSTPAGSNYIDDTQFKWDPDNGEHIDMKGWDSNLVIVSVLVQDIIIYSIKGDGALSTFTGNGLQITLDAVAPGKEFNIDADTAPGAITADNGVNIRLALRPVSSGLSIDGAIVVDRDNNATSVLFIIKEITYIGHTGITTISGMIDLGTTLVKDIRWTSDTTITIVCKEKLLQYNSAGEEMLSLDMPFDVENAWIGSNNYALLQDENGILVLYSIENQQVEGHLGQYNTDVLSSDGATQLENVISIHDQMILESWQPWSSMQACQAISGMPLRVDVINDQTIYAASCLRMAQETIMDILKESMTLDMDVVLQLCRMENVKTGLGMILQRGRSAVKTRTFISDWRV